MSTEVARVVFLANDSNGLLDVSNDLCELIAHVFPSESGDGWTLGASAVDTVTSSSDGWYALLEGFCWAEDAFETIGADVPAGAWFDRDANNWKFADVDLALECAKRFAIDGLGVELKYSALCYR